MKDTPMNKSQHVTHISAGACEEHLASYPKDLFIDGDWALSENGMRFQVINPATGNPIAEVADATIRDGLKALHAAEKAAAGWAATSPRKRADILMRCFEAMHENAKDIAALITLENGKILADARAEVKYAAEFFRWYAEEAVRATGDISQAPAGGSHILVQHQPIGIAVLVTPWNYPAAMATRKLAPALAAGCTCVLKPAAETPLTALFIAQLMKNAGVPDGAVNVVTTTSSASVVSALLHDPRVRKLSFTGSTQVGRILLREAADQIINCSMELGGNAPFIVFDDANLDDAVAGAMAAKMRNGGEACTAANRFYVQRKLYDSFVARFGKEMEKLQVGSGSLETSGCGPLISSKAVEKVSRLVDDAVAKGARVVTGGKPVHTDGYFYLPTVLADVPDNATLLQEEIFGPVAPIVPFDTEEEVIALANNTEFGLVAYIYSSDMRRALNVGGKIETGMLGINRGVVSDAAAPFGGAKQSGLGREGAHHGLMEYLEPKYMSVHW